MTDDPSDKKLLDFLRQHPRLLVLTGAGISTAAGLGDYRDRKGQWKRRQPIYGQTFINDEHARKRYWARSSVGWPSFSRAVPTLSHKALRQLQLTGHAQHLVTQNVDQLHQKAGHQDVIDLHGVLRTLSCIQCSYQEDRDEFQVRLLDANPWLATLDAQYAPDGDADLEISNLKDFQVPGCPQCAELLKPDVVFFGESVPRQRVELIMEQLAQVDALLVVGSSLMVYSGFRFCKQANQTGKPIVIINEGLTRADDLASLKISGDCGMRLRTLASRLSA